MDPQYAYRQQYSPGWTRADMLVAIYDGIVERLELAVAALRDGDHMTGVRLLTRAELLICELVSGVDPNYSQAADFLHRYGLISRAIGIATVEQTEIALQLVRPMRDWAASIREEASRLEREGFLPPAGDAHLVHTTA